jgi:peptide/nickel transport system permease protein
MWAYVIKRLLSGIVVLILISMGIFALFWYGPADPARPICNDQTNQRCSAERLEQFTENLGYNNPAYEEYLKWAKGIFVGREIQFGRIELDCPAPCLGLSFRTLQPVSEEMVERLPATISVAVGGAMLYVMLGVPIGIAAAQRRGTVADKALVSSFLVLSSVPYYLFALLLMLYTTVIFEVPYISDPGYTPFTQNPAKWFTGLFLAWMALGIFGCTSYTRYSRGSMLDALSEDYIRTAKAKGLPRNKVVYRHALRSALVPIVTLFGLDLGILLAGTIFTERIFDIRGIGWWAVEAVGVKDLNVVSATALFGATVIIVCNILVDVVYSILDPRVRLS